MLNIPLPESYHKFANNQLTNYTNIFFLYPLYHLKKIQSKDTVYTKLLYIHLFLLFIGSTYYHTNPTNGTIILDMFAVSSLTLLSSLILLDLPEKHIISIYLISILSVGYFKYSGNLIGHVLVLGGIPGYVAFCLWNTGINKELLRLTALLITLRLVEYNDQSIYKYTKIINGHSLKHILSVCFIIVLLDLMKKLHKI